MCLCGPLPPVCSLLASNSGERIYSWLNPPVEPFSVTGSLVSWSACRFGPYANTKSHQLQLRIGQLTATRDVGLIADTSHTRPQCPISYRDLVPRPLTAETHLSPSTPPQLQSRPSHWLLPRQMLFILLQCLTSSHMYKYIKWKVAQNFTYQYFILTSAKQSNIYSVLLKNNSSCDPLKFQEPIMDHDLIHWKHKPTG